MFAILSTIFLLFNNAHATNLVMKKKNLRRSLHANTDLDCMCSAYDSTSTRSTNVINDSTGTSCQEGFQNMLRAYTKNSNTVSDSTCEESLQSLPSNYCGFPDQAPQWEDSVSMEIKRCGNYYSRVHMTRDMCVLETFPEQITCEWTNYRVCTWNEEEKRCKDDLSGWFRNTYNISSTSDCHEQSIKSDCIRTQVLGEHCTSLTLDGQDVDRVCGKQADKTACDTASFEIEKNCVWHQKDVGRESTFLDCCDAPHHTLAEGIQWCQHAAVDANIEDGKTLAYLEGRQILHGEMIFRCDEIVASLHRSVFIALYESAVVNIVDEHCCIEIDVSSPPSFLSSDDPSAIPSQAFSAAPSNLPSSLPSLIPSTTPMAVLTLLPSTLPTFAPSVAPTFKTTTSMSEIFSVSSSYKPSSITSFVPSNSETETHAPSSNTNKPSYRAFNKRSTSPTNALESGGKNSTDDPLSLTNTSAESTEAILTPNVGSSNIITPTDAMAVAAVSSTPLIMVLFTFCLCFASYKDKNVDEDGSFSSEDEFDSASSMTEDKFDETSADSMDDDQCEVAAEGVFENGRITIGRHHYVS